MKITYYHTNHNVLMLHDWHKLLVRPLLAFITKLEPILLNTL